MTRISSQWYYILQALSWTTASIAAEVEDVPKEHTPDFIFDMYKSTSRSWDKNSKISKLLELV